MTKKDLFLKKLLAESLKLQNKPYTGRLASKKKNNPNNLLTKRINCHECIYFFVTWQLGTPYGCKAHGFKSKQLPSIVVFSSSGKPCLLFRKKSNT
jgi:hypothetical protein